MENREPVARALHERLRKVSPRELPVPIVVRLAFAVADAEVRFVDAHLTTDADRVTGQAVAFTDHQVFVVTFEDFPRDDFYDVGGGQVILTALARDALEKLEIGPVADDARLNGSDVWGPHVTYDRWPYRGAVALHYVGLPEPVVIPRAQGHQARSEDFDSLYQSLLTNLGGAARR